MSDKAERDETLRRWSSDRRANINGEIRCDAMWCEESHPIDHECIGEPSFATGRWLGWVYLDLNRPDLFERELRFCSVRCAQWWLDREVVLRVPRDLSPIDRALRSPADAVQRQAALRQLRRPAGSSGTETTP
jgi:hypothetical protein